MDGQTPIAARLLDYLGQGRAVALDWLTSPAAWSQFAIVLVAWLGALLLSRLVVRPAADRLRPPDGPPAFWPRCAGSSWRCGRWRCRCWPMPSPRRARR
ncbi:MAG: hypothetical protein ACOY5U_06325 [Pseudomonadota bacterium]